MNNLKKNIFFILILVVFSVGSNAQTAWTNYSFTNSPLPENSVRCIEIDNLGRKWIGTDYGLAIFDDVNWINYFTTNLTTNDSKLEPLSDINL